MNADGTGNRKLTDLRDVTTFPAWSPDGKTLAFQSSVYGGHNDVYTVPLAGGTPKRIFAVGGRGDSAPAWTPDRQRDHVLAGRCFLVTITDGKEQDLTSGKNNDSAPAWRPVQPK